MSKLRFVFLFPVLMLISSITYAYEMDIPKRYFEMGFNTNVGFSNNYFSAKEFLVEDLNINLTQMADDMSDDGLVFSMLFGAEFFSNLYLDNGMTFSLSTGIESNGLCGIGKDLFDFLGKGNSLNETLTFSADGSGDAFATIDSSYQMDWGDFGVRFGAGLFCPLMHLELDNLNATFANGSDGSIDLTIGGNFKAYGCGDLRNIFGDVDVAEFISGMNNGWGFDISGSVEHAILNTLQGRVYMRLPLIPGSLENSMEASVTGGYHADDFMDLIKNGGESDDFKLSDKQYGNEKFWLARPFRTGYEIKWRPFGRYVSFNHQLGFAVKYPWTKDAKAYMEYNFGCDASIFNILGFSLSSSYQKEVFIQQIGFMINARVLELDFGASVQGASFAKSWQGSGAGAFVGVTMGF